MIVNKRSGDDLAVAFSKILNKSLKKQASESAGQMLLENDGSDKYDDKNFMKDTNHSSDAEVLSNSLDDSMNMLDDPESKYMKELGGLVDLDPEEEPMAVKESKFIMQGLGKIAKSLSKKGDKYAADMVVATAHQINEDIMKEAAKVQFVKEELTKIASDLHKEGDSFSRDMVLATIKSL